MRSMPVVGRKRPKSHRERPGFWCAGVGVSELGCGRASRAGAAQDQTTTPPSHPHSSEPPNFGEILGEASLGLRALSPDSAGHLRIRLRCVRRCRCRWQAHVLVQRARPANSVGSIPAASELGVGRAPVPPTFVSLPNCEAPGQLWTSKSGSATSKGANGTDVHRQIFQGQISYPRPSTEILTTEELCLRVGLTCANTSPNRANSRRIWEISPWTKSNRPTSPKAGRNPAAREAST